MLHFSILDAITDAIAIVERTGKVFQVNTAWRDMDGTFGGIEPPNRPYWPKPGEDCIAGYISIFSLDEAGAGVLREGARDVFSGARARFDAEWRWQQADGSNPATRRWFAVTMTRCAWEDEPRALIQQRDISLHRRAEAALRASEESLAQAQRIARMGNWDWDIRNDTLHWSDEIYRIFGQEPRSFGASYGAFLETLHPEDRASVERAVSASLETHAPYGIEHRIVLPDGTIRTVQERGELQLDAEGQPIRMIGTVHDVTERKEVEKLLRDQTAVLRELASPLLRVADGVIVLPIIGAVDSARAQQVMEALLRGIEAHGARSAILDVTGVETMDMLVAESLVQAARAARLVGAEVAMTGIRADVAQTLVSLGVSLEGIVTLSGLQQGIAWAMRATRDSRHASSPR